MGDMLKDWLSRPWVKRVLYVFLILAVLLAGKWACSSTAIIGRKAYRIARDVSWYPLELLGKESNMVGFTDELFSAVAEIEDVQISLFNVASQSLLFGLDHAQWDGILSSMAPDVYNQTRYHFSEPFYVTGLAIVVREQSPFQKVEDLKGKVVGIPKDYLLSPIVAQQNAIFVPYTSMSRGIDDLVANRIDVMVMEYTSAKVYEHSIYAGKVKVIIGPLLSKGIRLVVRRNGDSQPLIDDFNNAFKRMQKDGTYHQMLMKWNLVAQ